MAEPDDRPVRPTSVRTLRDLVVALVVATLIVIAGLMAGSPAGASCMPRPDLATSMRQADAVAIGTVTATRSGDRIATIRVEEIWKGRLPATFELRGGPDGEAATTVDRSYETGGRYLLFVQEPALHDSGGTFGGRYEDNNCSATQLFTPDLARLRPPSATSPVPPADEPGTMLPSPLWLAVAGGVLVLGAVTTFTIKRYRRPTRSSAPG